MITADQAKNNAQNIYYNSLSDTDKLSYRFLNSEIKNASQQGEFLIYLDYSDKSIPSSVFSLLENNMFYRYMESLGYYYYYTPEVGLYEIRWTVTE